MCCSHGAGGYEENHKDDPEFLFMGKHEGNIQSFLRFGVEPSTCDESSSLP